MIKTWYAQLTTFTAIVMLFKPREGQVLTPNGVFTMWQTWNNITNEHYSLKQADQIKNRNVSNAISKTRYIQKYISKCPMKTYPCNIFNR